MSFRGAAEESRLRKRLKMRMLRVAQHDTDEISSNCDTVSWEREG